MDIKSTVFYRDKKAVTVDFSAEEINVSSQNTLTLISTKN